MPTTVAKAFLTFGLVLCLCSACDNPVAQRLSSRVLATEGKAQRLAPSDEAPLRPGVEVRPGETIKVAPGGRVDLMILPGIWVELEGDTEVQLGALHLERNGDDWIHPMRKREATLSLLRGSLYFALQQSQTRSRLVVQTPAGTVIAGAGRAGKVEARDHQVLVVSARDDIVFDTKDKAQRVHIAKGHLVQAPGLVTEPSPATRAQVREVKQVRERLFALADKTIARFPLGLESAQKRPSQLQK